MKLIVSIDTEEDDWGRFSTDRVSVSNIECVPFLQALFDEFSVRPTYLLSFPVASDPGAVETFKALSDAGKCEIGAHCHPWNTPPIEEEQNECNSMLCNLPSALQYKKLRTLSDTIENNFGSRPRSFRAGRWGFSGEVAVNLSRLGFSVDSSVSPYVDWSHEEGPDYSYVELPPDAEPLHEMCPDLPDTGLFEVPATIGFLQSNYSMANKIYQMLRRSPLRRMKVCGALSQLGLLNRIWLSPELQTVEEMIALTETQLKMPYQLVNLVFHSPTLKPGLTPFVRDGEEQRRFMDALRRYFEFANDQGFQSVTLSESAAMIGCSEPERVVQYAA